MRWTSGTQGVGRRGRTALFVAAEKGSLEAAALLLKRGADIDKANVQTHCPRSSASLGNVCALPSSRELTLQALQNNGCTPLFISAYEGHTAIVQELCAAGAHVDKSEKVACCLVLSLPLSLSLYLFPSLGSAPRPAPVLLIVFVCGSIDV